MRLQPPLLRTILLAALLAGSPKLVSAQITSALDIYHGCKLVADATPMPNNIISFPDSPDASFCLGAFTAIIGLANDSWADTGLKIFRFCAPTGATGVQFIRIFLKYVDDHPEEGHKSFPRVALTALSRAFPCKP
jgi:hypothetical protein